MISGWRLRDYQDEEGEEMDFITPYFPPVALSASQAWEAGNKISKVIAYERNPLAVCGNCQDVGVVYVSFLGMGPTDHPVTIMKASAWLDADGGRGIGAGWYIVEKTIGYPCPHCQGLKSPAHRAKPRPAARQAMAAVAQELRAPRQDLE